MNVHRSRFVVCGSTEMAGCRTAPGECSVTCLARGGSPPEKEEPMSWTLDGPGGAAVMRAADAEAMSTGQVNARLLLDSSATHEAASVVRVALSEGADGAVPHRHDKSSELFYVLSGSVQLLAGEEVLTAGEGDLAVVPPGLPHAFAAPPGQSGELLIIITREWSGSSTSGTWAGSWPARRRWKACSPCRSATTRTSCRARLGRRPARLPDSTGPATG